MTLDQQIALVENTLRMCKGAGTPDVEHWESVLGTLRKHERATEIMQDLEQDVRGLAGLSTLAKSIKAGAIALTKWNQFLELGQIFLKL